MTVLPVHLVPTCKNCCAELSEYAQATGHERCSECTKRITALLLANWAGPWEGWLDTGDGGVSYAAVSHYAGVVVSHWPIFTEQIQQEGPGLVYLYDPPKDHGLSTIGYHQAAELKLSALHEDPDFSTTAKDAVPLMDRYDTKRQIVLGARIRVLDNAYLEPTIVDLPQELWLPAAEQPATSKETGAA